MLFNCLIHGLSGTMSDKCPFCEAERTGGLVSYFGNHVTAPPKTGGLKDTNPKTRYGKAKPALELTLTSGLLHMAMAQVSGDEKYGRANWRNDPVTASTYVGALLRHVFKWWNGVDFDPESGARELGHVMNNAAILLDATDMGTLIDDRPPPNPNILKVIDDLTKKVKDEQPPR